MRNADFLSRNDDFPLNIYKVNEISTNSQAIDYAHGVMVRDYRGLQIVEHSGADAGFRYT